MSENEVREPIQKRSIEKKEKIIQKGFELICKKGYYNTNTAEIAKFAGVSTGIIYNYFKDKHDILIEGVKKYASDIFYPMINVADEKFEKKDFEKVLRNMISNYIKNHKLSQSAHEELISMAHSDKEIEEFFHHHEMEVTKNITRILIRNGFSKENLTEKVHIALGLIDNLCHEIVYHKHKELDYKLMTDIVINTILKL
ncbi:MAG: TetR/AcrR family transcriptional regulator [Clostridia bacterium]|nr:TetR/AcrR family transcriptional regulator [Clostridia bacterium]